MQVQGAIKKVNDRLTENLTFEYSLGYNPSGGAEHAGMKLLESLRGHQQKLALASNFVTALAAKNGPPSQPQALLAAKTALVEAGVPVSEDVQTIVVEKALKAAASAEDGYATFWKLLCPSGQLGPDDPDQGLTIDSLPENSEDHEQKPSRRPGPCTFLWTCCGRMAGKSRSPRSSIRAPRKSSMRAPAQGARGHQAAGTSMGRKHHHSGYPKDRRCLQDEHNNDFAQVGA